MKYTVYCGFYVSQVITVEADNEWDAMDLAVSQVDRPNISNRFEMDGEVEVDAVYDEDNNSVWER